MSITLKQLESIVTKERNRWNRMMDDCPRNAFHINDSRRNAAITALFQVLQDAISIDNKEN